MIGKNNRISSCYLAACLLAGGLPSGLCAQTTASSGLSPAVSEAVFPGTDVVVKSATELAIAGKEDEALALLDAEIGRSGEIPPLVLKAIEIEARAGKFDTALARVAKAQESALKPEPWIARSAELLEQANRIEEARSVWLSLQTRMEQLDGTARELPGNSALAARVKEALAMVGKNDRRAVWLHPEDLYEEEVSFMNKNISAHPSDASHWNERSLFFLGNGQFEQALLDCDETDRLAPGKYPTLYVRSQILFKKGETEKAHTMLDELLVKFPVHRDGHVARARLLASEGENSGAIEDFRIALQSSGDKADVELIFEYIDLLVTSGKKEYALIALDDRIAIQGNDPALLVRAIEMESAARDFTSALSRVDAILKNTPQPEQWLAKRAQLLMAAGRPDDARAAWQNLLARLGALPNLQRGRPDMLALAKLAKQALAGSPLD